MSFELVSGMTAGDSRDTAELSVHLEFNPSTSDGALRFQYHGFVSLVLFRDEYAACIKVPSSDYP